MGAKGALTGFPPGLIAGHEHAVHGEPGPDPLEGTAPQEVRRPPSAFPSHRPTAPGCVHHSPGFLHTGVSSRLAFLSCLLSLLLGSRETAHCLGGMYVGSCVIGPHGYFGGKKNQFRVSRKKIIGGEGFLT